MSSNLRIIRLRDLISLELEGNLDLSKAKEGIQEIVAVHGAFIDHDVLIDTRGTESLLSVFDIWEIARDLANAVHASPQKGFFAKIAVICPIEHFDNAKFLELCAQNRGLNVQAFTAFEDMFEWISVSSSANSDKSP
jgi:hypothetical protein